MKGMTITKLRAINRQGSGLLRNLESHQCPNFISEHRDFYYVTETSEIVLLCFQCHLKEESFVVPTSLLQMVLTAGEATQLC